MQGQIYLLIFPTIWCFQYAVFGVDPDQVSLSVTEGDSVTLLTDVKTNQQEKIKWYFNNIRIAQISEQYHSRSCTDVQCNEGTERFRDRLKLDDQTGSLTIINVQRTDSGLHKLQIISSNSIDEKVFIVTVHGVSGMEKAKRKSAKEGESVTLDTGVKRNPDDVMRWNFNVTHIAKITGDQSQICTEDQCKERFRNRLKLNYQTGSLTVTDTRTTDSGVYTLEIITNRSSICQHHYISVISVPANIWIVISLAVLGVGLCGAVVLLHRVFGRFIKGQPN
ncbi:uncharacterized protein LOC130215471 [Danio aesculapii]|uniref:uncharacterized protein LOC130215471 n=1 Tax=Danio aesculapii TaxID=1142201 RepID=UPI0024BF4B9A|nr:uncharacterized protein LOC130215471 [Danio aesculapii]